MNELITGLTVSVNYAAELKQGLPAWRKICDRIVVVTDTKDTDTPAVASENKCETFRTDVFYENGATFNKGSALEQARHTIQPGWVIVFDADIIGPPELPWDMMVPGYLYGARRQLENGVILREYEWPGFFWAFHTSDHHLPNPWWTGWKHAGCYDSVFERNWPRDDKVRLPLVLLHVGSPGRNWHGKGNRDGMEQMFAERRKHGGSWQHEAIG